MYYNWLKYTHCVMISSYGVRVLLQVKVLPFVISSHDGECCAAFQGSGYTCSNVYVLALSYVLQLVKVHSLRSDLFVWGCGTITGKSTHICYVPAVATDADDDNDSADDTGQDNDSSPRDTAATDGSPPTYFLVLSIPTVPGSYPVPCLVPLWAAPGHFYVSLGSIWDMWTHSSSEMGYVPLHDTFYRLEFAKKATHSMFMEIAGS